MNKDGIFKLRAVPKYEALETLSQRIPEAEPGAVQAYLYLLKISSDLFSMLDGHFARYGLSRGRFFVLMTLLHAPDHSLLAGEIANRLGVARATMTGLVHGLEREGLVRRAPSEQDRRRIHIRLTRKGRTFLDSILPDHYRRVGRFMAQLTSAEQKTLAHLLDKLGTGLTALEGPE